MSRRSQRQARAERKTDKAGPPFAPGSGVTPPASWPVSWWQQGYRLREPDGSAAVEACVAAIAQTVAQLPVFHWRTLNNGGREQQLASAPARVMRKPNAYQTRADFFHNLLRAELYTGNGYAIATRSGRFEIDSLTVVPPRRTTPKVEAESGEVFYEINAPDITRPVDLGLLWPARDVLHIRLYAPEHPLIGVTPLTNAALAVETNGIISSGVAAFMSNMVRPSGYLSVPPKVEMSAAVQQGLTSDWSGHLGGRFQGRMGVLKDGIKWEPLKMDAFDEAIVAAQRMTVADIARVFRVPLPVIGEMSGATYNNTETLIRFWQATGLGFILEHVEEALDALFALPPDEYLEFDLESLLRADFQGRMDGLTKAVQGGIYSPNEARAREGLRSAPFGDEPRLQAQVVPLSAASLAPAAPSAGTPKVSGPEAEPKPEAEPPATPTTPTSAAYSSARARLRYYEVLDAGA